MFSEATTLTSAEMGEGWNGVSKALHASIREHGYASSGRRGDLKIEAGRNTGTGVMEGLQRSFAVVGTQNPLRVALFSLLQVAPERGALT